MITNTAIQSVLDYINGDLTEIALGNGVAPQLDSAVSLDNEFYAKDITTRLRDGNIQVVEVYFDETEANGEITEFGAKKENGEMFDIEGADITKDSTQSLTVSIEIELTEVR